MFEFFGGLFDTSGFPARWHCGVWSSELGWLHILSDIAIFGAYTAIPLVLAFFTLRRDDIPFPRIFWLFGLFIFSCGFGHLVEAIIFWQPIYRFDGLIKLITALASWATVVALAFIIPKVLTLPGLARLNTQLREEVEERKRVETALRESEDKLAQLLTSERAARGDAERANQTKDEFLSTVSHELRTPLNAILGYAQLLLRAPRSDQEVDEGLLVIERNAKVQARIIEDLLDMSRIVSGKVRLEARPVDLSQVVDAAVATARPAADAKHIQLRVICEMGSAPVLGDSNRLQQVVGNLLTNALKFTPNGGRVEVTLRKVDSQVEVSVADTGQGISAEFLPHVFDRFRQADPGTTRRYGGLGLGLSIVKQLVELHGGSVAAESAGEGQGASFTVRLPLHSLKGGSSIPVIDITKSDFHRGGPLNLKGVNVLVVDDEPDGREMVKQLLSEHDATVRVAGSVDEALERFKEQVPNVLLSDIGMPDKDGYDLIRAVRAMAGTDGGAVPAIALTALARTEDRKRAMLAGYQAHITKPVDAGELVAVVATLTGRTGR